MLHIALSLSLLGILLLFLLAQAEPEKISIADIAEKRVGERVYFTGKVFSGKSYGNLCRISVSDASGAIQVIHVCGSNFTSSDVGILGRIEEYRGEMEINAERIEKVS